MHLAWRWRCIFTFKNQVPDWSRTSHVKSYVLVKSSKSGPNVVSGSGSKGLFLHFSYLNIVVINRVLATDCFISFMRCFCSLCLASLWRTYFPFKLWKARDADAVVKAAVRCVWMYFEKLWSPLTLSHWFFFFPTDIFYKYIYKFFFLYFRFAWQLVWCMFNSYLSLPARA